MRHALIKGILAVVGFAAADVSAVLPPAPGSYASCEVLSYSTAKPASGTGARLLSAPTTGTAETVETWVVRSAANTNRTFAVRRTLLSSGGISLCAYTPNRVLATLAAGKSYATFVQEMAAKGLTVVRELMQDLDGNSVYIIEAAETENDIVEQMTMSIESTGSCTMVRPDHIYEGNAVPNDTNYADQWALQKIGAPQAWDTRTDASSVLVAVLDTGVNYDHYDLNQNLWINSDEVPGDGIDNDGNGIVDDVYGMASIGGNVSGNPMDDNGHGSHCAGIIGAGGNNRRCIAGVAWKARIMGLKFLDEEGRGSVSDAITCLRYAEDHGVKIVNCSFGSTDWDDYLYVQMKKMSQQGTIFVCAAGNSGPGTDPRDNDEYPFYPCNYNVDTLVSVAATDSSDALASFSYYGAQNVDIAAPGVDIRSTVLSSSGLGYKSGTSMATPHVAGALALLAAHYPDETSAQIIARLYAAAEPISALAGKVRTGSRLSMAGFFGITPPTEISVSQGTVNDAVVIYWAAVAAGTHYRVWRAAAEDGEKTMLRDWQQGLTFSDETAEPGVTYWYYLQAAASIDGASASTYSIGVSGYRPVIDTSRITVSFNPAGGTVSSASKVYRVGEAYAEMPTPTYSGKAFLGWFTAANGGTRLDESSLVRADATTLYAHWIGTDVLRVENLFARQRYPWNGYVDITFNLFGVPADETASVSLAAQEEGGGSPLVLRTFVGPAPTNLVNGAQHVVWNATPDAQGILYTNMILVATAVIDEKPLQPPANVSASDGTDLDAVEVTWSASENATSYEVWRATANDSASASLIASPTTTSYSDTSVVPATTYWYWVKAVNSKETSGFSAPASGSRRKIPTALAITGPTSLTAGETATYTCTATYNDNTTTTVTPTWSIMSGSSYASISSSGVLTASGTATQGSVTVKAIYSYNGSTQTMTKNVTINTKSVTISFNANGGTVSPTSKSYTAYGTYGSLPTPSARTGYTFLGWFTEANGGAQVTTSSTVPASAKTLYAHWMEDAAEEGKYLVIDLSGGMNAVSYPVTTMSSVPSGGWTDEYKTTKLVLRKIPAGTFTMGCDENEVGYEDSEAVPHAVTISQPFYMGVFEVTQRQYELVTGNTPSSYQGNARPVENVSWVDIRGEPSTCNWPSSSNVDPSTFVGKIRARTGITTLDLPTEAKWEYACRAGTTTALNSGKNLTSTGQDAAMDAVGRYGYNSGFMGGGTIDGRGGYSNNHTTVGSYLPNSWGLYDMHGNVFEWCLDRWQARSSFTSDAVTDPVGPVSGSDRVLRSSSWTSFARDGRSASRGSAYASRGYEFYGFRMSCSFAISSTPDTLSTPTGLVVGVSNTCVPLSWDAVTGAETYEVWRGTVDDFAAAACISSSNGTSFDDMDTTAGVPYRYWVCAVCGTVKSEFSECITGVRYPRPVSNLHAQSVADGVSISWTASPDTMSYTVCRRTADDHQNSYTVGETETTCIVDTNAVLGVEYYYWVVASVRNPEKPWLGFESSSASVLGVWQGSSGMPLYCVIDLSGGPSATSYPVSYLSDIPTGGWTDEYKTTKLVLRKIPAGTFTMGSPSSETGRYDNEDQHSVTISKPFYMGVFEVTQKQYELVMGSNPSSYTGGKRPVESVSYDDIRGSSSGAGWPGSSSVDASSFMGRLRAKTGIDTFDLPTEAKWEYACRAGTTTALNSGKNLTSATQDSEMDKVGRYCYNNGYKGGKQDGKGGYSSNHTTVGSYQANNWGLYDMHGNVWEWTLDRNSSNLGTSSAFDPVGPASGSNRVLRGGGWCDYGGARDCRSARRGSCYSPSNGSDDMGFRLSCSADDGHSKVQLWEGGPYWAETNIGAEKPEDYGWYFWWGDIVGYKYESNAWVASDGSSSGFSFDSANTPTDGKDIPALLSEGWITADYVLAPGHDVAHVHWGGRWRMPTRQELEDLNNNCDWTWTTMSGINGFVVRGRGDYASNSIFLPAAGIGKGTSLYNAGSDGYYWSSELYSDYNVPATYKTFAYILYFDSSFIVTGHDFREWGKSVRPVQGVAE